MTGKKRSRLHQLINFGRYCLCDGRDPGPPELASLNPAEEPAAAVRFGGGRAKGTAYADDPYLPTYIPEDLNLAWPPSEIYAQDTPFRACIMHFTFRDRKEIGLLIQQVDSQAPYALEPLLKIREKKIVNTASVKKRKASLVSAVCDQDIPCNQLSWDEGNTTITLTGKIPARDIIRIAASMLPDN